MATGGDLWLWLTGKLVVSGFIRLLVLTVLNPGVLIKLGIQLIFIQKQATGRQWRARFIQLGMAMALLDLLPIGADPRL